MQKSMGALAAIVVLAGCVQQPMGPTVSVMPAPNKPFDVFAADQAACKQFAEQQVAGGASQANTQQVGTAVVGTALGAGLGAAAGGGQGAGVGAAMGAITGTAVGAGPAQQAQMSSPAKIRYRLRAMHVCERQSGARLPAGRRAAAAAAAAALDRFPKRQESPSFRGEGKGAFSRVSPPLTATETGEIVSVDDIALDLARHRILRARRSTRKLPAADINLKHRTSISIEPPNHLRRNRPEEGSFS